MAKKTTSENWKDLHGQTIKDFFSKANLPWKKLKLEIEGGCILNFQFSLTPNFFLISAREDLKDGSARGLINALTNAKRAIDCQTDSLLSAIGYSPKGLDKQLGKTVIAGLQTFTNNSDHPLKFLVLESLGILAPKIVNDVRSIRNQLEHQYKKPSTRAVRNAIDVAGLFVKSCQGEMNTYLENVYLGCGEIEHPYGGGKVFERQVVISLEDDEPIHIKLHYTNFAGQESADVQILPNDSNYLAFLRVLFAVRSEENIERAIIFAATNAGLQINSGIIKIVSAEYV